MRPCLMGCCSSSSKTIRIPKPKAPHATDDAKVPLMHSVRSKTPAEDKADEVVAAGDGENKDEKCQLTGLQKIAVEEKDDIVELRD